MSITAPTYQEGTAACAMQDTHSQRICTTVQVHTHFTITLKYRKKRFCLFVKCKWFFFYIWVTWRIIKSKWKCKFVSCLFFFFILLVFIWHFPPIYTFFSLSFCRRRWVWEWQGDMWATLHQHTRLLPLLLSCRISAAHRSTKLCWSVHNEDLFPLLVIWLKVHLTRRAEL